jgi:universal stress protein E
MTENRKILVVADFDCDADNVVDRAVLAAKLFGCELNILFCDSSSNTLAASIAISSEAQAFRKCILETQEEFVQSLATRSIDAGIQATAMVIHEHPVQDGILSRAIEIDPFIVMKGTEFHSIAERNILVGTDWQLMRTCPYPLWFVKRETFDESPTIVAAVDPMHEHDKSAHLDQTIVDAANSIAGAAGGEVHLIHTYERLVEIGLAAKKAINAVKLPIDEIDERSKITHREALDTLARKHGIDADHTHQLPGRSRDIIPTFVRGRNADLVVMGALARWGIKRMIIGSTAERIMDHLPSDVLIVRDNEYRIEKAESVIATRRRPNAKHS